MQVSLEKYVVYYGMYVGDTAYIEIGVFHVEIIWFVGMYQFCLILPFKTIIKM